MITYKVYILKSQVKERYYIGHTKDLEVRLADHNRGKVKSTKAYMPWFVIYTEDHKSKSEAFKREMQIKKYKSGEAFKKLIKQQS